MNLNWVAWWWKMNSIIVLCQQTIVKLALWLLDSCVLCFSSMLTCLPQRTLHHVAVNSCSVSDKHKHLSFGCTHKNAPNPLFSFFFFSVEPCIFTKCWHFTTLMLMRGDLLGQFVSIGVIRSVFGQTNRFIGKIKYLTSLP